MGTTANFGFTYPALTDAPNAPAQMQVLAAAIDAYLLKLRPVDAADSTDIASVTSATFAAGSPVVGVSFTAPPSGKVYITPGGQISSSTNQFRTEVGWELRTGATIGAGTVVSAASADRALSTSSSVTTGAPAWVTGSGIRSPIVLTPGAVYNVQTMHRTSAAGGTGTIMLRTICVEMAI